MFKPQLFPTIVTFLILGLGISGCTIPETTPVAAWQHAEEGAYAADISTDGKLVVISGVTSDIRVWRVGESSPVYNWAQQTEGNNLVSAVHIAADNSHVVTADRNSFALWSLTSGEPVGFWRIDESTIRDLAVSNNGQGVLVARANGKIMFFEHETQRRLEFLGHTEKVNSIDLSPNGKYALSGGNDYLAYLWSTDTGQIIHTFTHSSRVTKVVLDDAGRYAFTADSRDKSQIWDVQTGERVSQLQYIARQQIFTDAVFSEDGKYLLTGSPARRAFLWDVTSGEKLDAWEVAARKSVSPPTAVVYGVGFAGNGMVLTTSSSGLTEQWGMRNE